MKYLRFAAATLALALSCSSEEPAPPAPLPPHCFAFAVFGDGPYRAWEEGRFHRIIEDVNRDDLQWFIHVGDLFWYPCSEAHYARRLAEMNSIRHPVVYTPGDNEWADCHHTISGHYQPLERLRELRAVFFAHPGRTLGARTMRVTSQAENPDFAEFVENARWVRGGFVFATVHMVGSNNAAEPFKGRTPADDEEEVRRARAAVEWMDEAFTLARADSLHGVVIAMHGDPGLNYFRRVPPAFEEFIDRLEEQTRSFTGQVVLIHGDSHKQRTDHPLKDEATGEVVANFTRIEAFGSPDIGWVRVVVDSVAGRIVSTEPRRMRGWLW